VSRVNEPAPTGPYFARVRPVEQQQRDAGSDSQARGGDVLAVHVQRDFARGEVVHPVAGSSRAYLFVLGLVALILGMGAWLGGPAVMAGVGLGWLTALLLWVVRKDLATEFQELFW
jgi:Flp pilus assembly protein TadB